MRLLFCILLTTIFSCSQKQDETQKEAQLMNVDKSFSDLSKAKGMNIAFLQFMDKECVLLRPQHSPIIGEKAIDFIRQNSDTSFSISWQPQKAIIAKSNELGYTYGVYSLSTKDTSMQGTYVTIWKKQADGNWKFVLDSGNPGLGN